MLLRMMEYLAATVTLGLYFCGCYKDLDYIITDLSTDADNGEDVVSAKSTTGFDTALVGPDSWGPIEWGAKGQTVTGRNTPESEIIALDYGVYTWRHA